MDPRESETQREHELKETLDELALDIGRILHANTSTLLMVNQTLISAIETLAGDERIETLHEADVDETLAPLASKLARAIERLTDAGTDERRGQALESSAWDFFESQVGFLDDFQEIIPVEEMRHPALRKSAHQIVTFCRRIEAGHLPKETVRDVLRLAERLERNACLYDALTTRAAVIQMDASLRALRDFITADLRGREASERLGLERLVRDAVSQLAEFAAASHVEVKVHVDEPDLEIEGEHRELSRAVANLLHNAIKYSWHRDRGTTPWVGVRLGRHGRLVSVEFETWGVPITREELEEGMVFRIGYRGKFSTDRGRLGTGIGLTDAQRVAQQHGGTLTIESQPARTSGILPEDPEYYRQPFLTRTRLELPGARH